MTLHRLLPALLLLAACRESQSAGDAASAETQPAPSAALTSTRTEERRGVDLPDAGDPRLFLSHDDLRWSTIETRPPADREARLRALGIAPVRADPSATDEYPPSGEKADDFHFVDFSGDGVDDVIYSGPWYARTESGEFAAMEGEHLKLWQVMGGRAVLVMDGHGRFQRLFRGGPGEPASFRAFHHGCCADPEWSLDYYRPVRAGDTVRYQADRRVQAREGVEVPATFLPRPRAFTVANDRYLLREAPAIDPATEEGADWNRWQGHGNALAEYGRGARGIALAERTDATGRVWWFVWMDGRTPPRDAQFAEPGDGPRTDRLGWMSSRFLAPGP